MADAKVVSTPMGAHFKLTSLIDEIGSVDPGVIPYSSDVGSVMYAMIGTRPNVACSTGLVSSFTSRPGEMHYGVKGSRELNLVFTKGSNLEVQGFCDSDHVADQDKRRSISGYVFTVGGNTVSWKSSLQHVVALSSTQIEFIALTENVKEAIWIRGLLDDMGLKPKPTIVWCDSQSVICLSKNNAFHDRTKHVEVKFYISKDIIKTGGVKVRKIHTFENSADMLTKCIPVKKFEKALDFLKLLN